MQITVKVFSWERVFRECFFAIQSIFGKLNENERRERLYFNLEKFLLTLKCAKLNIQDHLMWHLVYFNSYIFPALSSNRQINLRPPDIYFSVIFDLNFPRLFFDYFSSCESLFPRVHSKVNRKENRNRPSVTLVPASLFFFLFIFW